ncbi:MAG: zinc finger Ran-binding domain-containing protein, partial [candidate division WOR-3 bacterium]
QLQQAVVTRVALETFTSPAEAAKRIFPEIEAWERKREEQIVAELLNAATISARAAVGLEPTLKFIQEGRASLMVIVRGFDREVFECPHCRFINTGSNQLCSRCGADGLRKVSAAAVLPQLVVQFHVPIEIVAGPAGQELAKNGGIGVLLRF